MAKSTPKQPKKASAAPGGSPSPAKKAGKSKSPSPSPKKAAKGKGTSKGTMASAGETPLAVYLFVPNLIGYARVLLTAVSMWALHEAAGAPGKTAGGSGVPLWVAGIAAYASSFVLDFFDGYAARAFNQSSNFGAVLDMVTDRVSTMLLLMLLGAKLEPQNFFSYAFLAALDYSSHWVQMYSSKGHHKSEEANKGRWLPVRIFYGVYPFFAFCCAGTEFFYIFRAVLHFSPNESLELFTNTVLLLACVSKNVVNMAQLLSGFETVAKRDVEERAARS